jgi:peptidoglycan/xylan/chitin deacetylase (PgdA/CDA1 family)
MYHEITDTPHEIHAVKVDQFAAQVEWLARSGYSVLDLQDWITSSKTRILSRKRKSIAITFDDGYLDNYTNASPILEHYGFCATVFLVTGYIGKTSLWRSGKDARIPLVDWPHIYEMQKRGICFGSHSIHHVDLGNEEQPSIEKELCISRKYLSAKLGQTVNLFSYPFSGLDRGVKQQVKAAGYSAALTYKPECVNDAGRDLYELNRIGILATDSLLDFIGKVKGSFNKRLRWYKLYFKSLTNLRRLGSK